MKAIAVFPGKPDSVHLAELPKPAVTDVPGGRGVLREVIPRWLDDRGRELIRRYERRPDASGADGGLIVWVRPLEPDEQEGD